MPIFIPPTDNLDVFEEIVAPMDQAIRNNHDEICRLEQIRDSLLPKLMSGELDKLEIGPLSRQLIPCKFLFML